MNTKRQQRERIDKEAFWLPHLSAWQSCGLSIKDYCQNNALKHHQFKHWQSKLCEIATQTKPQTSLESNGFVEVKSFVSQGYPSNCTCEISSEHGFTLTLPGDFNAELRAGILICLKGMAWSRSHPD